MFSGHILASEFRSAHLANQPHCVGPQAHHTIMLEPPLPASRLIGALRVKGGASHHSRKDLAPMRSMS